METLSPLTPRSVSKVRNPFGSLSHRCRWLRLYPLRPCRFCYWPARCGNAGSTSAEPRHCAIGLNGPRFRCSWIFSPGYVEQATSNLCIAPPGLSNGKNSK